LSECGYRVLVVTDGSRGLVAVNALEPDLIIVELLLPGRSGFRVLEAVKARPRPIPTVVLASIGGSAQRALAEHLGADTYLRRPVSLNRLIECVNLLCPLRPAEPPVDYAQPSTYETLGAHVGS
jgi:DNA-binding response OmpR family regulator